VALLFLCHSGIRRSIFLAVDTFLNNRDFAALIAAGRRWTHANSLQARANL
jgi:hypothetical protein